MSDEAIDNIRMFFFGGTMFLAGILVGMFLQGHP